MILLCIEVLPKFNELNNYDRFYIADNKVNKIMYTRLIKNFVCIFAHFLYVSGSTDDNYLMLIVFPFHLRSTTIFLGR